MTPQKSGEHREDIARPSAGYPEPAEPARPLFSVLVPVYNHAHFVRDALNSLIAQTDPDWEALVVDDGSTDATPDVLAEYARRDSRIRTFRQENAGGCAALNAGLRQARGRWICWLSADDLFDARKLEIHRLWAAKRPDCRFFYTHFKLLEEKTGKIKETPYLAPLPRPEWQVIESLRNNLIHGISICIDADAMRAAGGFAPELWQAGDFDMWLRLLPGCPAVYIPERTCITRIHEAQESAVYPRDGLYDSAKSAIRFLNRHSYAELFPLLDLGKPEDACRAVERALDVAGCKPAFLYALGPHSALILRILEWAWGECPPESAGTIRGIIQERASHYARLHGMSTLGLIWRAAAAAVRRKEPQFRYQPIEPVEVAEAWYWELVASGSQERTTIRRYLERYDRPPRDRLTDTESFTRGSLVTVPEAVRLPADPNDSKALEALAFAEHQVRSGRRLVLAAMAESSLGLVSGTLYVGVREAASLAGLKSYWESFGRPGIRSASDATGTGDRSSRLSVNIGMVTYNRLPFTREAIQAIIQHTKYPYTLTVVDNGSLDGTAEYLKRLHQEGTLTHLILLRRNIGVAGAANLAWLQEPDAAYFLKLDNDIIIQKDGWLESMVQAIERLPELGIIGYNFEPVSYKSRVMRGVSVRIKDRGNVGGACFMVPRRTQRLLGRWCEAYARYGFEDVDYCARVSLSGLLNGYMEDENVGVHLPAGKAPVVDLSYTTRDGIEEHELPEYRKFKDNEMRRAVSAGWVQKRLEGYQSGALPLHFTSVFEGLPRSPSESQITGCLGPPTSPASPEDALTRNSSRSESFRKPVRVDLGCGDNKPEDCLGVDSIRGPQVDLVADLTRFFPFRDDSVDYLRAHDAIEHWPDRLQTMNEIWRVCRDGATVDLRVPSTDGRGAFQDPTHISFWNINSFLYYCEEFPVYYELCRKYGFKGRFRVLSLKNVSEPDQIVHVHAELIAVKPDSDNRGPTFPPRGLGKSDVQQLRKSFPDANLHEARMRFWTEWKKVDPAQMKAAYQSAQGEELKRLLGAGAATFPLPESEGRVLAPLVIHLKRGTWDARSIHSYLAALLFRRPHDLPIPPSLGRVPEWLVTDFVGYLMSPPLPFLRPGESECYSEFLEKVTGQIHREVSNHRNEAFWQLVARAFAHHGNFILATMNEHNVRRIFEQRAGIVGIAMESLGARLDCDFPERSEGRRIRLGILRPDFRPSPEAFATLPVFEHLPEEFEVFLYALSFGDHPLERYCCDRTAHTRLLGSAWQDQVHMIRSDNLDILYFGVNLSAVAHFGTVLGLHRLALIQATGPCSLVTTGSPRMDFYVSGEYSDPAPDAARHYSEDLLKMGGSAHCFSYGIAAPPARLHTTRGELGLSTDDVVLASVANVYKLVPELLMTWCRILALRREARLLLMPYGPHWAPEYPREQFGRMVETCLSRHGLTQDRILIADFTNAAREDIRQVLSHANIYLDSFPCAGSTSLVEPLENALPVLTRRGKVFRSAMGAGLLQELGIPEMVVGTEEEYVNTACQWISDPDLRAGLSQKIRKAMAAPPRFLNSRKYAESMAAAFKGMLKGRESPGA
jgi:predicted O-linked N-acetylglucosamine transferase (SPINDLY family)/glycosyltransferase involved in cell wall biosynthesis/SAM-dependent methyltransferase